MIYKYASIALLCVVHSLIPSKTHNLHQSKQCIQSPDGIKAFVDQIEGGCQKNIGKNLPKEITIDELSQLVFKKSYQQMIKNPNIECNTLIMQKGPGRLDYYIGVGEIKDAGYDHINDPAQIFITLFKIKKPHHFEIVAHTQTPFRFEIDNPTKIEDFEDGQVLDEFVRIDCAMYQIAPQDFAFGLRLARNEGYSGGFAQFHNLILFVVKDTKIVPVLNVPIYCLQNLAGDWNEDGTRQHFVTEREWVVCVTNKKHNGYFDLQIKQKKTKKMPYRFIYNDGKYRVSKH